LFEPPEVSTMSEMMTLRVTDRAQLREWQAVADVVQRAETPDLPVDPPADFFPLLEAAPTAEAYEFWLGMDGGETVAAGRIRLPLHDNLAAAMLEIQVLPDHRRRGHGTAMYEALLARCRILGRSTIFVEAAGPLDETDGRWAGELFMMAAGARAVTEEVRYRLVLDDVDSAALEGKIALLEDNAVGYRTQSWTDGSPPELLDDLARLAVGMSTDAPLGDMSWEPERWTSERYLEGEALSRQRGRRRIDTAVVATSTGRAVGVTVIGVSGLLPDVGRQGETIVAGAHRGHRLGLLLKLVNLRHLMATEPRVRVLVTWNAAENTHMRAINEQLGFVPVDRWREWQLELA
jgi:GNAT superfamily N-acetyltransferase/RimJ/RimL family protein N-acetyltransferase